MSRCRLLAVSLTLAAVLSGCKGKVEQADRLEVFEVKKGDLQITVTESGSLQAAQSLSIKNQVARSTQILEMVEEGTVITDEDVKAGKILVRLDATKVEEEYQTRVSSYESAKANLTEAKESSDIQESDNESTIRGVRLELTFAMTDLRKLVGDGLAEEYAGKLLEDIDTSIDTGTDFDPEKLLAQTPPPPAPKSEGRRGGMDPKKIEAMIRQRMGLGPNDPLPEDVKQRMRERRGRGGRPGEGASGKSGRGDAGGHGPGGAGGDDGKSSPDAEAGKAADTGEGKDGQALAPAALKPSLAVQVEPPEDIPALLNDPELGGEALQTLRTFQSDIELAKEELSRAQTKLKWTEKLFEKDYATKDERDGDALSLRRREILAEKEETKLAIFRQYEFPKSFQKNWSNVLEARAKLERQKAMARSKLAQRQAQFNSRIAAFRHESERLESLKKDIESCTIRATRPGLVVLQQQSRFRNQAPLEVGTTVNPQQTIFEFPDITNMIVNVDIHEAVIDVVRQGQKATIALDAIPGKTFPGQVSKKAVLPSSQSSWLNPDLKMYKTEVAIDGQFEALRPGMTATVEILAEQLEQVTYVPIQAVQTDQDGKHYCYKADGSRAEVSLGKRNQVFVVVTEGLKEGDQILMAPPELTVQQ